MAVKAERRLKQATIFIDNQATILFIICLEH
jgi:hypothetical protein